MGIFFSILPIFMVMIMDGWLTVSVLYAQHCLRAHNSKAAYLLIPGSTGMVWELELSGSSPV